MLAKAFESQENKEVAVQYYREALKANCESFEAFNRLVASYLITHSEKEELINQMNFSSVNLWLKDYYISRIRSDVRNSSEYEGIIKRVRIDGEQSSHLCAPSDHDESGMTPPRFQTEVLNDDDVHLRRVPGN